MSGGAYDYGYFKITMLAEEIEEDLDKGYFKDTPEARSEIIKIQKELVKIAKKAKAVEWFASGDWSQKDLLEELKKIDDE